MVLIFLTLLFILVLAVFFVQIVDRKRRSGKKPWSKCIVDVVCSYVMIFHTGPWAKDSYPGVLLSGTEANVWGTTEKFIKRIMIESKKTDLGGSLHSLSHNYDLILQGIIKSGVALSPFGYFFINESLKQKMQQRLGLVNFIANHPHIESISVRKPVIITGLTRTGTTFLHELLHLHPDGRSHVLWEQLSGIPEMSAWADDESLVTRKEERVKRRRQQKGDFDFGMSLIGTEALQIIHRVGYDLPEGFIV